MFLLHILSVFMVACTYLLLLAWTERSVNWICVKVPSLNDCPLETFITEMAGVNRYRYRYAACKVAGVRNWNSNNLSEFVEYTRICCYYSELNWTELNWPLCLLKFLWNSWRALERLRGRYKVINKHNETACEYQYRGTGKKASMLPICICTWMAWANPSHVKGLFYTC